MTREPNTNLCSHAYLKPIGDGVTLLVWFMWHYAPNIATQAWYAGHSISTPQTLTAATLTMDSTCGDNQVQETDEARVTDSLMMQEIPAAAADAPKVHIIGGKLNATTTSL